MFDGSFEDGNLRKDFNLEECAKGIASAVIANQISNFALAKLQNLDAERLKRGLLRLGIPQKEWKSFLRWLGIKNADHIAEGVEKSLEELLSGLKKVVPSDQWNKFVDDFGKDAAKLAKFDANPKLVDSWKGLINQPDWVRKNTKLLERLSGESDEFIKKVDDFYATTMKNNTPANFEGAGRYTNNVYFDEFGFPDFSEFNPIGNQHVFSNAVGKRADDFKAAKKWMQDKPEIEDYLDLSKDQAGGSPFKVKINGKWSEKMTWHHHENGKDLIPVLSDIHNTTKHTGGVKVVELGLTKITN